MIGDYFFELWLFQVETHRFSAINSKKKNDSLAYYAQIMVTNT